MIIFLPHFYFIPFFLGLINCCTCQPSLENPDEKSTQSDALLATSTQTEKQEVQPLKLYYLSSPPSRAVLVMLKLLNVPYELRMIDEANGELNSPEYLKINPQGTVPVLEDKGFYVLDSHAINAYLAEAYGGGDKFYPKDIKARSVVNHRMYFDAAVLATLYRRVYVRREGRTELRSGMTEAIIESFETVYGVTEAFMKNHSFIAGDEVTIADISVYISLTVSEVFCPLNPEKFPLLVSYLKRCEEDIQYLASINQPYIEEMKAKLKELNFKFEIPTSD